MREEFLDEARRSMVMEAFMLPRVEIAHLREGGNPFVAGEGPIPSQLMFIGEAPGRDEARLRRPFVGASGKLLRELMEDAGIRVDHAYITNVVKYRPPENRNPTEVEIEAHKPLLRAEVKAVNPRVICLVGAVSLSVVFPDRRIGKDHGKVIRHAGRKWVPLYHPSYVLRRRDLIPEAEKDMYTVKGLVL